MKKSSNLNNKQKVIEAFKILKKSYPQVILYYDSTYKYYWHIAILSQHILYSSVVNELIDNSVRFAVTTSKDSMELQL